MSSCRFGSALTWISCVPSPRNSAGKLAAAHPKELTTEHSIAARKGRVYLDPFRNGFGQTVVTPYSVRRKPKAPVSTPLAWTEVKPSLIPSKFNIGNFAERAKKTDPWSRFFSKPAVAREGDSTGQEAVIELSAVRSAASLHESRPLNARPSSWIGRPNKYGRPRLKRSPL